MSIANPVFDYRGFVTHDARLYVADSAELPVTKLGGTGTYCGSYTLMPANVPFGQLPQILTGGTAYPVGTPVPLIDQPGFLKSFLQNLPSGS